MIIDSAVSTAKEGGDVQFVRRGVIHGSDATPNKRHPYRSLGRENIFRHDTDFVIFDMPLP
jgi:hypothetical protein